MSDQAAEAVFDALGEPVRRRILELLHDGPTPVGRLAERLPVGRPAVSKHLRVLSDAGLIEHRSVGTRNLYVLAPGGLAAAQQWLAATWDAGGDLGGADAPAGPGRPAGRQPGRRPPVRPALGVPDPHARGRVPGRRRAPD
jgi:DNA-binding transcriptional ArsR family regulator